MSAYALRTICIVFLRNGIILVCMILLGTFKNLGFKNWLAKYLVSMWLFHILSLHVTYPFQYQPSLNHSKPNVFPPYLHIIYILLSPSAKTYPSQWPHSIFPDSTGAVNWTTMFCENECGICPSDLVYPNINLFSSIHLPQHFIFSYSWI